MTQTKVPSRVLALAASTVLAAVAIGALVQARVDAANADVHFKELMAGANGNSRVQFIVIEQQPGQNLWGPQAGETESRDMLVFFDAAGRETGKFKFPLNPPTGGSLQTLIATEEFANLQGAPVPDVIIPPLLIPIAGKVCFKNNPANPNSTSRNECVSYGNFTGDTEINFVGNNSGVPAGPPAASLPVVNTVSLRRAINTGTNPDFQLTTSPTPTNIAGASIAIAVASTIEQGRNLFNKETFLGNGRTCATCHAANDNLRLSPGNVQSRFATLASPTFSFDPLFVGEFQPSSFDPGFDFNLNTLNLTSPVATPAPCTGELRGDITTANGARGKVLARVSATTYLVNGGTNPAMTAVVTDGVCAGTVSSITAGNLAVAPGTNPPGLEDPMMMRFSSAFPQGRGLILENIDGFSNPAVFRKSPHLLNLDRTGPFGLSGNFPDLQSFVTQAVKQHFPRTLARNSSGPNPDFRLPTADETAAIEAFMRAQEFPAGNDPNKFDLDRFATTSAQKNGRAQFFGTPAQPNCSSCHGGPTLSQTTVALPGKRIGVNASFNTGVANIFTGDSLPCEPSAGVGPCNSREFSVPPLFNLSSLGPFFHNASVADIQSAVGFYDSEAFFDSPANAALNSQGLFLNPFGQIVDFLAGLTPRPYTMTQGPIRFGVQPTAAGPTASQSISITNTGLSALAFSGQRCSITGADFGQFVVTSCPLASPLLPGQTAVITVAFDPISPGLKSAVLEVNTAIPSGIDLFGVGDAPLPAPILAGIVANSGTADGGDSVTLTGTNFSTNGTLVTIGGVRAGFIKLVSPNMITARTGPHAPGSVDVVVTNPDGQSAVLVNGFNYTSPSPLSLASIVPLSGSSLGSAITINGTGFKDGAVVTLGGVQASAVNVITSAKITATAPSHAAASVDLCVRNLDGQQVCSSNAFSFVFAPAPSVSSVTPISGSYLGETNVTIQGSGFGVGSTVTFGGAPAVVITQSASSISVLTGPHAPGTVGVVVTNPDGQTATLPNSFSYLPPQITFVNPNFGSTVGGAVVGISGDGFASGATVTFGGSPATDVSVFPPTFMSVRTPLHAVGSVNIVVTNPDGQTASLAGGFNYVLPTISNLNPISGGAAGGTEVTILGSGFGPGAAVTFDGVMATNVSVSDQFISATTPPHAPGIVNVVVTNTNGTSATRFNAFTYVLPTITSISPTTGNTSGGTNVVINGGGFAPGAKVTFGGVLATITSLEETMISVETPAHAAGSVDVVVTNPNATSVTRVNGFTYALPSITSVSPNSGNTAGGTAVNISGIGFNAGATVTFGGVSATNVSGSETFLSVTTPAHAANSVNVVVTNPNGTTATLVNGFTYLLPTITSVTPTLGNTGGGTVVNITGTGFNQGATVTFGGVPGTNISASETFLTATTPAHTAGSVNVVVTNPNGTSVTKVNGFTYVLPSIDFVNSSTGNTGGSTFVIIFGTGFNKGATITIGGQPSPNLGVAVEENQAFSSTPPHAPGFVNVTVTNPDGASVTKVNAFQYVLPSISSVSPTSGPANGGTSVTVSGQGLGQGAIVTFGGVPATDVIVFGLETSLTATTPAHVEGIVDVVVTNPNGVSATKASAFTYAPSNMVTSVSPTGGSSLGGTSITITGVGFSSGATVKLGGVAATNVVVLNSSTITAVTKPHVGGVVSLLVTNPNGVSGSLTNAFTYVPADAPHLISISPGSGSSIGGTPLTITGSFFAEGATVKIGGVFATNVVFVNSGLLTATLGPHAAGVVDVSVINPDTQTSTLLNSFSYILAPPPTVTSIIPPAGTTLGGVPVTIVGIGFGNGATVTIGGQAATNVRFVNSRTIIATTAARSAEAVDVVLNNPDSQSGTLPGAFTYTSTPSNDNFANRLPLVGATSITALGSTTGATSEVGEPSDLLGQGSGTPSVWWTWTATCSFTIASPNSFINTRGSSFDSVLGIFTGSSLNSLVPFASDDDSSDNLTSQVPSSLDGGSSVDVVAGTVFQIRVRGFTGSSFGNVVLHIDPPCGITGVSPSSGPYLGGTNVTVIGSGFTNGATVAFGGVNATGVTVVDSATITATTAQHGGGPVDVIVINPNQTTDTFSNGFTFVGGPRRRGQITSQ